MVAFYDMISQADRELRDAAAILSCMRENSHSPSIRSRVLTSPRGSGVTFRREGMERSRPLCG